MTDWSIDKIPPMTDRALPTGFLIATAFASGLVWLCSMVAHLPVR